MTLEFEDFLHPSLLFLCLSFRPLCFTFIVPPSPPLSFSFLLFLLTPCSSFLSPYLFLPPRPPCFPSICLLPPLYPLFLPSSCLPLTSSVVLPSPCLPSSCLLPSARRGQGKYCIKADLRVPAVAAGTGPQRIMHEPGWPSCACVHAHVGPTPSLGKQQCVCA